MAPGDDRPAGAGNRRGRFAASVGQADARGRLALAVDEFRGGEGVARRGSPSRRAGHVTRGGGRAEVATVAGQMAVPAGPRERGRPVALAARRMPWRPAQIERRELARIAGRIAAPTGRESAAGRVARRGCRPGAHPEWRSASIERPEVAIAASVGRENTRGRGALATDEGRPATIDRSGPETLDGASRSPAANGNASHGVVVRMRRPGANAAARPATMERPEVATVAARGTFTGGEFPSSAVVAIVAGQCARHRPRERGGAARAPL